MLTPGRMLIDLIDICLRPQGRSFYAACLISGVTAITPCRAPLS